MMSRPTHRSVLVAPGPGVRGPDLRSNLVFWAGALAIALGLLGYYSLTWPTYARFNQVIDVCRQVFCDFDGYYFPMGQAIFRTALPVDGFVYSPFVAILLAAFAPLRLRTALVLWAILQAGCVLLYIAVFRRLIGASLRFQWLFVLLLLSSFPFLHTIKWGQVTLFSTVAVWGALVFMRNRNFPAGAALLAFAASFKFIPLIFVAPFAARRDVRLLAWIACALAVFLLGVPVVFLGFRGTVEFYRALLDAYMGYGWAATSYNSQYFPHVMLRLVGAAGAGPALLTPPGVGGDAYFTFLRVAAWVVVGCNVFFVIRMQSLGLPRADLWGFGLLFLTLPFLLGTSWPVDFVFLPFVQALLAAALFEPQVSGLGARQPTAAQPDFAVARKTSSLLLVASIVCSNVVLFNGIADAQVYGSLGFVFWSDLLLLVTFYLLMIPALLQKPSPRPRLVSV